MTGPDLFPGLPPEDGAKRFRLGTHRARDPGETLERALRHAGRFGLTRVAVLTGLDVTGIPVAAAIRPNARSLSVFQGKGATLAAAKASRAYLLAELKELDLQILPLRMNLQGSRAASPQARIQVHRSSGGETRMIEPSLDAPLEPGDVLEVSLVLSDPMTIEPGQ